MKIPPASLRVSFPSLVGLACFLAAASVAHSAPLTSWTQSTGTGGSQLNTASPIVAGPNQAIYAAAPVAYTLSVGDSIKVSGGVAFTNITSTNLADQFRFGLFNSNGSSGSTGWLGYIASNAGPSTGNSYSRLWERTTSTTGPEFWQNGGAQQVASANATPSNNAFASGSYTLSLTYTRISDTALSVAWTLIGTDVNYTVSGSYTDTSVQTFTYDRFGVAVLGLGSATTPQLGTTFSNMDLTYTAVPEPAAVSLLGAAGLLVFVLRRHRARRA